MNKISIIISTYNYPGALSLCLKSLLAQQDTNFEIIIADDGSTSDTQKIINDFINFSKITIRHVFHEDNGFRAAKIRNKAVANSTGDYLIFLDGDCIALPQFVLRHKKLAAQNYFVTGNRILLNQQYTKQVISKNISLYLEPIIFFILLRLQNKINRIMPLLYLPLGFLRTIQPKKWQKAMSCNLGIWRDDFIAVNGFDELFEGWGYEDSDLIVRLIHSGVKRKEGRFFVPVLHLWHTMNDRANHDENYQRLLERANNSSFTHAIKGVKQYLQLDKQ